MKECGRQLNRIPIREASDPEPLSISGFVRTDGILTGYVLSNGLKITIDERVHMEKTGELE